MGLDMYIHKVVKAPVGAEPTEDKPEAIEVAYWRKCNQIHKWFVENIQEGIDNCKEYLLTKEQLIELSDTCKRVLADHSLAEELLPPQAGFFFGSTEIGERYFEDLEGTVEMLEPIIQDEDPNNEYYYMAWW